MVPSPRVTYLAANLAQLLAKFREVLLDDRAQVVQARGVPKPACWCACQRVWNTCTCMHAAISGCRAGCQATNMIGF